MTGERQQIVNEQQQLVARLEAEQRDKAIAKKAMVAQKRSEGLVVDPITQEVFKEMSIVLDATTHFTLSDNAVNTKSDVAQYIVPNGVSLYFRAVKSEVDRNAPYLYGSLKDSVTTPATLSGVVRVRVYDATLNELRGQPFTGSCTELGAASSVNWLERLFFNSRQAVRANSGDIVVVDLVSASTICWDNSTLVMHLIQLTKQT